MGRLTKGMPLVSAQRARHQPEPHAHGRLTKGMLLVSAQARTTSLNPAPLVPNGAARSQSLYYEHRSGRLPPDGGGMILWESASGEL